MSKKTIELQNFYVQELRERERFVVKRYTKLANEYLKMKRRLKKLNPVAALEFQDPSQL